MAALTADREDAYLGVHGPAKQLPVAATTTLYLGGMVSVNTDGYVVPAVDDANQDGLKIGIVLEHVDNSAGADGDVSALVVLEGEFEFPAGTLVQADILKTVHAADDATLALTSTNNRPVGILEQVRDGRAFVRFQ